MATDKTKVEAVVEVNAQQPRTEVERLSAELASVVGQINQMEKAFKKAFSTTALKDQTRALKALGKQIKDMESQIQTAAAHGPKYLTAYSYGNRIMSDGEVVPTNVSKNRARAQRLKTEINNTDEQVVAQAAESLIAAHKRGLKASEKVIKAYTLKHVQEVDQLLARTTESALKATSLKFRENLRQLEVSMSPENLLATQRLHAYRTDKRLQDSRPAYLEALARRDGASRHGVEALWSDPQFAKNMAEVRNIQAESTKRLTANLPLQRMKVAETERQALIFMKENADEELQDAKEKKRQHGIWKTKQQNTDRQIQAAQESFLYKLRQERADTNPQVMAARENQVSVGRDWMTNLYSDSYTADLKRINEGWVRLKHKTAADGLYQEAVFARAEANYNIERRGLLDTKLQAAKDEKVELDRVLLKKKMEPENVSASIARADYALEQQRLSSTTGYLSAMAAESGLKRERKERLFGDQSYVQALSRNQEAADKMSAAITKDSTYQLAEIGRKQSEYLLRRERLLDRQLQDIELEEKRYGIQRKKDTLGDPAWQTGRRAQQAFDDGRMRRRGDIGVYSEQNENILKRLSNNGGADIMAIQARVMTGYMALSGAINMVRNFSTFIVELDREFKQFQAITNTTAGEMVRVKKELIGISEVTKFTALEVAQAATILGQAGLSAQNITASIEAITLLATAAGSSLNESVETVTSTLTIFNLQADQATQIANTFTAALNGSKLSMDKITLGLQYAGNTAAQFGVTYQELTAMMGAMANSGIKSGSTLGTGMRMLMVGLTEPTKKFRKELERVGLSESDVDLKAKGLVGVLKTLREAGFGASEAYNSFEVRAASAFAALTNNLDLGIKLEESFVGSTAALKANQTQMESLANQYDRFRSALGTVAYNSMSPFIEMMADLVKVSADAVTKMNTLGPALSGLSVAFVGLGTAIASRTLGALLRGGVMALGFDAIAKGALAAAAATGGFSKALAALTAIARSNPFTLLLTVGATAATAFYALRDGMSELEKKIEATEALVSRSKQQIETLQQGVTSIDQTISNLRDRQAELEKDPLARRLKIREVIDQFADLGLSVNSATSSVDDLITALQNLQNFTLSKQIDELQALISANQLLMAQKEQDRVREAGSRGVRGDVKDVSRTAMSIWMGAGAPGVATLPFPINPNAAANYPAYLQAMPQVFGSKGVTGNFFNRDYADIVSMILDPVNQGRNTNVEWGNSLRRFETRRNEAAFQVMQLEERFGSDPKNVAVKQELETMKQLLKLFDGILLVAKPLIARVEELRQLQQDDDRYREQDRVKQLETDLRSDPVLKDIIDRQDASYKGYQPAFRDYRNLNSTSVGDREQLIKDFEDQIEFYEKEIDNYLNSLNLQGYTPEEVRVMADTLLEPVRSARRDLVDILDADAEVVSKLLEKMAETERKRLSKNVGDVQKKLGSASTSQQVKNLEVYGLAVFDQIDRFERDLFQKALAQIENDEERQQLITKYQEDQGERDEARKEFMKAAVGSARDIEGKVLSSRIDSLKAQEAEIQRQLDDVTRQIREGGAGLDFSGLMSSLNALYGQLASIASQRVDAEFQNLSHGGSGSGSGFAMLANLESRGQGFSARGGSNNHYVGRMQFGQARLDDFSRAHGVGRINRESFRNDPALQEKVEEWHFNDILSRIRSGQAGEVGKVIQGVIMDEAAMLAVAHKQGFGGLQTYMRTGNDQKDGFGTANSTYARMMSGLDVSNYDAFRANALNMESAADAERKARERGQREANTDILVKDSTSRLGITDTELQTILARSRTMTSPAAIKALLADVLALQDKRDTEELNRFDLEHQGTKADPRGREELIRSIAEKRNSQITQVLDAAFKIENDLLDDNLTAAQQRVQEMERPENVQKFSDQEHREARKAVEDAETARRLQEISNIEGRIAAYKQEQVRAAQLYGEGSQAALYWGEKIVENERENAKLAQQVAIARAAQAGGNLQPYQDAVNNWQMGTGYFVEANGVVQMKDAATQTKEAWEQVLNGLQGGFENFFMSFGEGFSSLSDSVKALGLDIVKMFQQAIAKALAFKTVTMLANGPLTFLKDIVPFMMPGAMNGTIVPRRAAAGDWGVTGRDSVPYLLEPGEAVLRRSAVSVVGEDKIKRLNNLGNRVQPPALQWPDQQGQGGGVVNVWVVTPDQQPPLTERDIVAAVSTDIANRGSLKQLIKSVQMGQL